MLTYYTIKLGQLLGNFMEQLLGLLQSLLIAAKFRFAQKNQMNLFMTITIDFRLLLKKILVFLQMFIPPG